MFYFFIFAIIVFSIPIICNIFLLLINLVKWIYNNIKLSWNNNKNDLTFIKKWIKKIGNIKDSFAALAIFAAIVVLGFTAAGSFATLKNLLSGIGAVFFGSVSLACERIKKFLENEKERISNLTELSQTAQSNISQPSVSGSQILQRIGSLTSNSSSFTVDSYHTVSQVPVQSQFDENGN